MGFRPGDMAMGSHLLEPQRFANLHDNRLSRPMSDCMYVNLPAQCSRSAKSEPMSLKFQATSALVAPLFTMQSMGLSV